jgi:predicted oxidoreductase (fatty acid repression mutant protein)
MTQTLKRTASPLLQQAKRTRSKNAKMGAGVSSQPEAPVKEAETKQTSSSTPFLDAIRARRSIYALNNTSPISDEQIESIVKEAILHTPSTFNTQSTRLVLLLHKDHETFWGLVKECLKPLTPPDKFPRTATKMDNFAAAYGTILFYEDQDVVKKSEQDFALYADRFQNWSEHTSAMHQLVLWTALEGEGFGANLQHYNPVVDESAAKEWDVPDNWSLKAQIVFGGRIEGAAPAEKQFKPVEDERLKVFGKQ